MMNERPGGNVVELPLRVPEAEAFEHEELARLYIAWRRFLLAGTMPKVTDFSPRLLGRLLAFAGIVEHAGGEEPGPDAPLRWRLAGSVLCRLSGREITGEEVFSGWQRFERATLRRLLWQTLEHQQAFLARLQVHLENPMEVDGIEVLTLPLLDAARGATVALMVFRPRFDTDMVVPACLDMARLTSLRTLHEDAGELAAHEGHVADVLPLFGDRRQPA